MVEIQLRESSLFRIAKGLLEEVIFELKLVRIGIYLQEDKGNVSIDKEMVHSIMVREFKIFTNSKGGLNYGQNVKLCLESGPSTGGFNGVVLCDDLRLYWRSGPSKEGLMLLSFVIF